MQHASATRIVQGSPDQIWALLSDVTTVARYHPAVREADLLSDQPVGLGATRRCNFYDGTNVREEVVAIESGSRVKMSLSEFSLPMKQLDAEWRLSPTEDGFTEVTFDIGYVVKWGLLGQLAGATAVRYELGKVTARVLAGLAHHVQTGELVGQDFKG